MIVTIIYYLGQYGPLILTLFALNILYGQYHSMYAYLIGLFFNMLFNYVLKGIIQQPRPSENYNTVLIESQYKSILNYDRFGMPSGHAQASMFTTTYLYLVTLSNKVLAICILISLITMFQRIQYLYHTPTQVLVGSVLGILVAILTFSYTKKNKKGRLQPKKDDNYFGLN